MVNPVLIREAAFLQLSM